MSFDAFDQCLDSWAVLNGRGAHRLATKHKYQVRVCRYGLVVRKHWRSRVGADKNQSNDEASFDDDSGDSLHDQALSSDLGKGDFPGHDEPGNVLMEYESNEGQEEGSASVLVL